MLKPRSTLLLFFVLFTTAILYGQNTCLSGTHFIRNQADVDAILTNYPDCEIIEGNIFVWDNDTGEDITNLNGFSNIKEVQGFFQLRDNPILNDLSGLSKLESIGSFIYIQSNDQLTNLEGLNTLNSIGDLVFIGQNPSLESLSGLNNIGSIGGDLTIRDNDVLNDISALEGIDPNSIEASDASGEDLTIINNQNLSECSIENICEFFDLGTKTAQISNNSSGCQNSFEIIEICSIVPTCIPVAKVFDSQQEIDDFPLDFPYCTHILGDIKISESVTGDILNLDGLAQVEVIGGALAIEDNLSLSDLTGLSNLDTVGRFLKIENNSILTSLAALTDLQSINSLILESSALENLEV